MAHQNISSSAISESGVKGRLTALTRSREGSEVKPSDDGEERSRRFKRMESNAALEAHTPHRGNRSAAAVTSKSASQENQQQLFTTPLLQSPPSPDGAAGGSTPCVVGTPQLDLNNDTFLRHSGKQNSSVLTSDNGNKVVMESSRNQTATKGGGRDGEKQTLRNSSGKANRTSSKGALTAIIIEAERQALKSDRERKLLETRMLQQKFAEFREAMAFATVKYMKKTIETRRRQRRELSSLFEGLDNGGYDNTLSICLHCGYSLTSSSRVGCVYTDDGAGQDAISSTDLQRHSIRLSDYITYRSSLTDAAGGGGNQASRRRSSLRSSISSGSCILPCYCPNCGMPFDVAAGDDHLPALLGGHITGVVPLQKENASGDLIAGRLSGNAAGRSSISSRFGHQSTTGLLSSNEIRRSFLRRSGVAEATRRISGLSLLLPDDVGAKTGDRVFSEEHLRWNNFPTAAKITGKEHSTFLLCSSQPVMASDEVSKQQNDGPKCDGAPEILSVAGEMCSDTVCNLDITNKKDIDSADGAFGEVDEITIRRKTWSFAERLRGKKNR